MNEKQKPGTVSPCPLCRRECCLESCSTNGYACPICGNFEKFSSDFRELASDILIVEQMTPHLHAPDRKSAIRAMVGRLVESGVIGDRDAREILDAALHREQVLSTGIGNGIAIPHARHPAVNRVVVCAARLSAGIPYESLDDQPVHLMFLLISPPDQPRAHVQALSMIARHILRYYRFTDPDHSK